ncbi:M48 family metalloprotease [Salinispirillum marinum]|uniref:M48 family metalloprotease n=2 Tax=Saccharospirillaceae TaxID=255527 RepID=A0ABV8BD18_9GAMM
MSNIILSRRRLIHSISLASLGLSTPLWLSGCAVDPITGKPTLMMLSEDDEVAIDQQQTPLQFSADYGVSQDAALNQYVSQLGRGIHARSHRPNMPYNYQVVNANYVNAYAFPGGSIAVTRGILLELESEAELAALLGHEIGHVTARHSAARMTQGMLAQAAVGTAVAGLGDSALGGAVGMVGQIGAGALLARYSRDNERQADQLGMDYMVLADHNPKGMVELMDMLRSLSSRKPNAIELMFSSHPMSDERYANVQAQYGGLSASVKSRSEGRERYMDMTARVRALKPAIEAMQEGERLLAQNEPTQAESRLLDAERLAPNDYTGLVLCGKFYLMQEREQRAVEYFDRARAAYPGEGQAIQYRGLAHLGLKQFGAAREDFLAYEAVLPGNPGTDFLIGYTHDQEGERPAAAQRYQAFLGRVQQGEQAEYAYARLAEWGYI